MVLVALTVTVNNVHVNGPVFVALTPAGGILVCVTVVLAIVEQPFADVTVTE